MFYGMSVVVNWHARVTDGLTSSAQDVPRRSWCLFLEEIMVSLQAKAVQLNQTMEADTLAMPALRLANNSSQYWYLSCNYLPRVDSSDHSKSPVNSLLDYEVLTLLVRDILHIEEKVRLNVTSVFFPIRSRLMLKKQTLLSSKKTFSGVMLLYSAFSFIFPVKPFSL